MSNIHTSNTLSTETPTSFTQGKGSVKFVNPVKNAFFSTLRKRVDEYFTQNNLSKYGNRIMVIKTITLLMMYLVPFAAILYFNPGWIISLLLWAMMGVGM